MAVKTTQIDGDMSLGRNIAMGGKATIAGSTQIGQDLIVKGWLDAPNIKAANKGVFTSLEALEAAYPEPQDGWFAGIGDSTPFTAYTGQDGSWVATGGTIDITTDMTRYTEDIEQLQQDSQAMSEEVAGHELRVADLEENTATKQDVKDTYGDYRQAPEYLKVITDAEGHILLGVKNDGTFFAEKSDYVDKADGKALIDKDVADASTTTLNDEFMEVHLDAEGRVLYGVKKDGTFYMNGLPENLQRSIDDLKENIADYMQRKPDEFKDTIFKAEENAIKNFSVSIPPIVYPTGTEYRITAEADSLIVPQGHTITPLEDAINTALQNGETNIVVYFPKGEYYCDASTDLDTTTYSNACISFVGEEGAVIIGGNINFNPQNATEIYGSYAVLDMPEGVTYAPSNAMYSKQGCMFEYPKRDFIEVSQLMSLTEHTGEDYTFALYSYAFPDKPTSECTDLYIQITQWYETKTYKVLKIENGIIYFTGKNVGAGYGSSQRQQSQNYAVNNDYFYGKQNPRYRLLNYRDGKNIAIEDGKIYIPTNMGEVTLCQTNNFVKISGTYSAISVSNIKFAGFAGYTILKTNSAVVSSMLVQGCTFESVYGAFSALSDNNHVINNYMDYTIESAIKFDNTFYGSANYSEAVGNTIKHCAIGNNNKSSIRAGSNQYLVKGNKIYDYGYSGIYLGVWYGTDNQVPSIGIAENNYLEYTDEYFNSNVHGIMDSGGIYVCTKNDYCVIRYNYVRNYNGAKDNRGIFLDDGAINVKLYQNIILNIDNRFAIDSRRVDLSNNQSYLLGDKTNCGNTILYNIMNANYKLQGCGLEKYDDCIKGRNFIVHTTDFKIEDSVFSDVEMEDDYNISQGQTLHKGLYVPKAYKDVLSFLNVNIRKFIHFIN